MRASIGLMASEGLTNQEISTRLNMHYNSVSVWRSRFLEALPHLREVQESTPDKLSDEISKVFADRPARAVPVSLLRSRL